MASRLVKRNDRRASFGVNDVLSALPGQPTVLGVTRDDDGRLGVCLDYGDHRTRISWTALAKAILARRPLIRVDALEEHQAPMLAELPPEKRAEIIERYRDLLQIKTGSRRGDPEGDRRAGMLSPHYDPLTTSLEERIAAKRRELRAAGGKPSSRATIYRQLASLDEGPDVLIHRNRKTLSQRLDSYDPAVLEIVRSEVRRERHLPRKSQRKLLVRIRARLDEAGVGNDLSRGQLLNVVGEASRGLDLHQAAKSRTSQAARPTAVYGRRRVSRPGELVQVDATPTTIAVLGPDGVYVKAVILTAIDVYTRCIVALRVCVQAADSRDVCALIAQMGRPTVTRTGYPYELEYWHGVPSLVVINHDPEGEKTTPQHVIGRKPAIHPSTIVFDHGSENASDHVLRFAAECGIDVVFAPPRRGHAKGVVEAIHKVIGGVESTMPTYKGQNVLNRPRELEDPIPIRPQDLQDMLWEYIIDVYALEEHRGLTEAHGSVTPLTPAQVWADYITRYGKLDAPADPYLFLKGLQRVTRQLSPSGVHLNNVTYNSAELQQLRSVVMSGISKRSRPLTVFFDRLDITRVIIRHPVDRTWMVIPRALDRGGSVAPMSGLARHVVVADAAEAGRHRLTEEEIHHKESELLARWRRGVFKDRKDTRFAAIEDAQQRVYAHDLQEADAEVRALLFPADAEVASLAPLPTYPDDADADDVCIDDEEIDFGDIDLDVDLEDEDLWGIQ